jgi:cation diffusion facilitator CzcD-associated flavoprotein CzcO
MTAPPENNYDILIIGAGISGINFAYRLQERLPHLSFAILEGRSSIGGTWDLFKYPGIRSDSDLYTFGFSWRPWTEKASIAEGGKILSYLKESAAMYCIDKKIKFQHHVNSANWSSKQRRWVLQVTADGKEEKVFQSQYLFFCTGYYDYDVPLQTVIPGIDNFQGPVVHPQFWPKDLDYTDKNIVIIGSGATAITLLPAMAKDARHVTMLQRSPSYLLSQPREDGLEVLIRKTLPTSWAHQAIRWKWLIIPWLFINFCTYLPNLAKKLLRAATIPQLPKSLQHDPHFKPLYNPFEQRMCFCPDGDFYGALREGKASVVTGHIDTVSKNSIKLKDGTEVHPDIIVTATGLKIRLAGGVKVTVDDSELNVPQKFLWKNIMLQDLPNCVFVIGYVDASWTLGADATARLVCRMIKRMMERGYEVATPKVDPGWDMKETPMLRLTSTYVQRAKDAIPKAGDRAQWRGRTTYFRDIWEAWFGDLRSGMEYQ